MREVKKGEGVEKRVVGEPELKALGIVGLLKVCKLVPTWEVEYD